MAFTPMSTVYLLDTPLDKDNKNQLHFSNVHNQFSYFKTRVKHTFESVTYQRKDNRIRVNKNIDHLWDVNYVMYQNANFANKWFYAYITRMEYVSDVVTDIFIDTDVYQSWLEETTLKASFVIREHVINDTIGFNMVDEQLETGEYITGEHTRVNKFGVNWNILAVSDNTPLGDTEKIGNLYGDVMTGLSYYPFPNNATGAEWLKATIELYDAAGKTEALAMIFTVPALAIEFTIDLPSWTLGDPIASGAYYGWEEFILTQKPTTIDGYTPKNNKLLTYPYHMLYMSNSTGQSAELRYEHFLNNDIKFYLFAAAAPNLTTMIVPMNYKSTPMNYENGLTLQGFPLASWNSDTYTAWFAQNSATATVAMIGSVAAVVGGIATGNIAVAAGGALGVAAQLGQIHKAQIQPDQAKGQSGAGNIRFASNTLDYYYSKMNIRSEFAKRIDDFFSMYGYKVNTVKIPEVRSRINWNYVQTIDVNIDGAIPTDDMTKLKKMYNDGVTFWHNAATFLNYNNSNTIRP